MLTASFDQPDVTDPPAATALPSQLPQSDANPMLAELNRPALEREQQEANALTQWRAEARQEIDDYALNFDKFSPEHEEWVRHRAIVSQFLNVETDQDPGEGLAYDMLRDQAADVLFEGRGRGSDAAFFGEMQRSAQGRKDSKNLHRSLQEAASLSETARSTDFFSRDLRSFAQWRDQARTSPGYDPKKEADYLEAWETQRTAVRENLEPYLGPLAEVWNKMQTGEIGQEIRSAYSALPEDQRQNFMASLALLARGLPKEQQPAFWSNISKQTGRDASDLLRGVGRSMLSHMEKEAKHSVSYTPEQEQLRQGIQSATHDEQLAMNFAADVRRIQRQDFDPIQHLAKSETGKAVETGLYGIPGALTSTATAIAPGGVPLLYLSMEGSAYEETRQRLMDRGLSDTDASAHAGELAPWIAAPQAILERVQAEAILGKLPFFEKALGAVADKITNRALRFGVRATTGALEETAIERTQDFMPAIVEEVGSALGRDLPAVQWTGDGGEFDGFWTQNLSTFVTMLPLSLIGATGGLSRDQRNRAVAKSSNTELLAWGVKEDNLAEIRAGQAKGDHSLGIAVDQAIATLDPRSESAKTATQELAEAQQAAQQTAQEAERSGVLPRFQRTSEGWTVFDGETNEEVGTAPDAAGAFRLAKTHSEAVENMDADRVAYLATMLQAGDLQSSRDSESRETTTDFRPGETVTTTQQAAGSEQDAARVAAQVSAKERLNGGDGSIAQVVFGQSRTEIEQKQRRTLNRLNAGASVLTVFHEEAHGFYREAIAAGRLTRDDTVATLRAVEAVLAGRTTKDGQALRFLPENDADVTDTAIDEAVAELMEAEILRTRGGGRKRTVKVQSVRQIPSGIISRNLSAIARLAPGATEKFTNFLRAVRSYFGLAFSRAVAIKQGIREGKIDAAKLDDFTTKLLGLNEQDEHDTAVAKEAADLLGTYYGEEAAIAVPEGDPFSIGRATITPTQETHLFEGVEGSPSVLGPAAFSIGAYHGTPHKVDKFSTDKIGTGEGAQAYGWGLYFASDRKVAEHYRQYISAVDGTPAGHAAHTVAIYQGDTQKALQHLRGILPDEGETTFSGETHEFIANAILSIEDLSYKTALNRGNLYAVNLRVEADDLLDWDKPLDEQPPAIRDAILRGYEEMALVSPEGAATPKTGEYLYRDFVAGMGGLESRDPAPASTYLAELGIKGIRYLDGGSRAEGEGSYNYVIFNHGDIEITHENGEPIALAESSFSLGSAAIADAIRGDALARIKNPLRRAQAMERISRKAEALRLQFDRLELLAGSKRLGKSLRKEAAMREAQRAQELENEAYARHWGILSNDDLTRIKSQPAHSHLADPKSPLRGRLMSKAAAIKKQPDLFQLHRPGDYDGSDGLSRSIFGGTLMPDQAAQELYDAGLIKEPTTDALWDKLREEQNMVAGMKDLQAKAMEDIRNARKQAKAETNVWLAEQTKNQATHYSPKEEILRTLATLDGILAVLPPHIRGEIGGYTQLARIGNDVNRLAFLRDKLGLADAKLESWLRVQYAKEMEALLKRAKPDKSEEGHKPRGKIGSDLHDLFRSLEAAMSLSAGEVEAEAVKLESLVESGEYTADQESHMTLEANLLRLVADWEHADAARREAALLEATRVFESGYFEHRREVSAKREQRAKKRDALQTATGKQGERMERVQRAVKDSKLPGRIKDVALSLLSFEQIVRTAFGENTSEANHLVDWERKASAAKEDAIDGKVSAIEELFADLAGGKYKGEQLRWKLSQPGAVSFKDWKGREQTFSELEAITATLMWRQEDGRRHMEGHVSDEGKPVGDWHWREQDVADLEDQLSPEAKAIRLHIAEQYGTEYDRLNVVFRDLYGVSLPRHKNYSPLTVKPVKTQGGQMLDPVTGATMSGSAFSPGSLKTRSQTAVAEPDFRDALQTYLAHTNQMEHFMAYAPFATEAMALINSRDVGNAIEAAGGKETLSVLRSWLDHFAQGGTRDAAAHLGMNKFASQMNSRLAAAALAGRVSVLAIQSTQLAAALAEMPTGSYFMRFTKLMTGQLGWRDALRSDYIQRRLSQMPPVVRQAMEGLHSRKPSRLKHAAERLGRLISGADALFTAGTYAIVFDYQLAQAKKLGLTGKDSTDYAHTAAERSTDRVAQPTRAGTRSLYENTATHPAARLMWAFASESRQKLILAAYAAAKQPAGAKFRAFAVTWGAGGVIAALMRAALRDLRDDEDDEWFDERNWDPGRLALASLTGPLQGMPMLGEAIESALFTGLGEYRASGTLLNNLAVGGKALTHLDEWFTGERDFEGALKDIEDVLGAGATFSGNSAAAASFSHIARDLLGIYQNATGE
jgi:hypothetical protein